ncbi:MAG: type II toxin-antitoxin system RelE/ParE family toxin [Candidatus Omnitrophica bacterium]|nr:type II toxin-antitoxin system RelE/ParE family toxin [Candidatus Omnitrophota bacterium]
MPYQIAYLPVVVDDDLPKLNADIRARIRRAIEQRLTTEPQYYGEPLRHQLKGFWRLRVGDYRVIYRIESQTIWVVAVGHRKVIYALRPVRFLWRPS